jgi:hypothetical protein
MFNKGENRNRALFLKHKSRQDDVEIKASLTFEELKIQKLC